MIDAKVQSAVNRRLKIFLIGARDVVRVNVLPFMLIAHASAGKHRHRQFSTAEATVPHDPNPLYFTLFTNGANPWILTSRRSPDSIGPTPLGVPVRMTSPGSKVMLVETKLRIW